MLLEQFTGFFPLVPEDFTDTQCTEHSASGH